MQTPVSIEKITGMVKAKLYDDAAALLAKSLIAFPKEKLEPVAHERMVSTLVDLQKLMDKSNSMRIDFMGSAYSGFCVDGCKIGEHFIQEMPKFNRYEHKDDKLLMYTYFFHTMPLSIDLGSLKIKNAHVWSKFSDPLAATFSMAHALNDKTLTVEQLTSC